MEILYDDNENTVELRDVRNLNSDEVAFVVGQGSTSTSIVAASLIPPPVAANEFVGRTLVFDDATLTTLLRGRIVNIDAQTIAGVLTVATLVAAPIAGDLAKIIDHLNAATVQVTLKDAAGVNVTGETWPKTMAYVTGSKGRYRATLSDAIVVTLGQNYKAIVTVESSGLTGRWELDLICQTR